MSATPRPAAEPRQFPANPAVPARIGLGVIAGFLAIFALWSAWAPLSGAAIAAGNLKAEGSRQTVQHPYGGVVQRLMVREGDRVAKGQVLVVLSDAEPRAKLDVLLAEDGAQKAAEARLIAQRDNLTEPDFEGVFAVHGRGAAIVQAAASEKAILAAQRRQYDAEGDVLRQRIAQLKEQAAGAKARIDGAERQAASVKDELGGVQQLAQSGYAPRTRVMALERTVAQLESERGVAAADAARAQQAIGEAEIEIAKLERKRVTEVTTELRAAQSKLAELAPKIDAARDVLGRTQVTAPATGSVVGLSVFTEGGVIQPGGKLLDIVPADDSLIAEGRLLLSDVDEVRAGRAADVRLTSVPRNERPTIRGEVMTVSADRLTDERTGQGYYAVRARLDADDVRNARLDLQSGMPVEIVMPTRARTLVAYLIGPLLDEMSTAFRER
jgi:HlyD family type I secretion membrane fusion protein